VPIRVLLGTGMVLVGIGLLLMVRPGRALEAGRTCCPASCSPASAVGMINPPLATTQVGVVPPQRSGMASGIGNTFPPGGPIATRHRRAGRDLRARGHAAHACTRLGANLPGGGDLGARAVVGETWARW